MADTTTQTMTAEQFFEWTVRHENQGKRWELERGEVIEVPSPTVIHGVVCFLLARLLGEYVFSRKKGYLCTNDSGLIVERSPDTVRGPDLMFFDDDRSFDQLPKQYAEDVPQLIVEVISPSDQTSHINRRVSQYLKHGVPLVWLVDPELRCVTVYQPEKLITVLDNSDALTGGEILPDFRCRVSELFTLPGQS